MSRNSDRARELMRQKIIAEKARKEMAEHTKVSEHARRHMHRELEYLKPAFGRWTPTTLIKQYHPKDGEIVWVQISGTDEAQIIEKAPAVASWSEDEGWVIDAHEGFFDYEVKAWMPLPRPYGGGKWPWEE